MPRQKSHDTRAGKKEKKLVISKKKLRKMKKGADRQVMIEQGKKDPAYQGVGPQGGTKDEQKKRTRKKSKQDASKYRNQRTSNLED